MDSAPEFPKYSKAESKSITKYLEVETEFMAAPGFYTHSPNARIRSHAVSIIATLSRTDDDPDAYIAYLALNYFDRYFSTNQFQDVQDLSSDSEKVHLIALCCLLLSAKMRTETFSADQFLRDKSINFTHERIMEMELNILSTLHWQMQPVTAFMYLNYYYRYFRSLGGFKRRCIYEIIVQAQGENEFVCYKPSQIAMSAFLVAVEIAYPSTFNKLRYPEELSECVRALGDLCRRKNLKIEPLKSETSSKIAADSSREVVEDKTGLPIRRRQGKGKEVVHALEAGTAQREAKELSHDELIAILTEDIDKKHLEEGSLVAGTAQGEAKKLSHAEVIKILKDDIGYKRHPKKGLLEARTYRGEAKKPSHSELIAILTEEIGNETLLEEGSLECKPKAIVGEIEEITEEEIEVIEEEKRRQAKGKAIVEEIVEITEEIEVPEEENRRLAKGKAIVEEIVEITAEEKGRLAKGKVVALFDSFDEERQRRPPISDEEKKKLDKEEQEKIARVEAAIKLAMRKRKVEKGAQVGGLSELKIVNEPEKLTNFDLKWPAYIPF